GGNGFFASLSLEDDNGGARIGERIAAGPGTWESNYTNPFGFFFLNPFFTGQPDAGTVMNGGYTNANYVPDVVLRAGVSQGWGAVWAAVAYDEDRTKAATVLGAGAMNIFPFNLIGVSGHGAWPAGTYQGQIG